MKKLDGNIIKLFGLITQLPQDAVGIWEFYNKKDYGSVQTLKWFIRGLCLAGALPVYGLKNNPDFDWRPIKEYGTLANEIAENIAQQLENALRKNTEAVDKIIYGIWFAIPELYEFTDNPKLNAIYQNIKRDQQNKTFEEKIVQNVEMFVEEIYEEEQLVETLYCKVTLKQIIPIKDKTFIKTKTEMENYIRRNLMVILQMANVIKEENEKWIKDDCWGDSPEEITEKIILEWKISKSIPNITLAFPQFYES